MFVRSQDGSIIKNVNELRIIETNVDGYQAMICYDSWNTYYDRALAFYSTKGQALKVLNMIEESINKSSNDVFRFPLDIDVI